MPRSRMPRDFAVSYNCELKKHATDEELLDYGSSDNDDETASVVVDAASEDKENSYPNCESRSVVRRSSGCSKRTRRGDVRTGLSDDKRTAPSNGLTSSSLDTPHEDSSRTGGSDVALDLSDGKTAPSSRGSGSHSLDTLHKDSSCSSDGPSAPAIGNGVREREGAVPIISTKGRDVPLRQGATGSNRKESSRADRNAPPGVSNPTGAADPTSWKPAHDSTTKVVSLPDLGLSPLAQLSELHQLGIDHSKYKPPSHGTCPDPIIHKLDARSHPTHARRSTAVDKVFSGPIKNLWKTKFASFNHVQSEMAHVLANSNDNVIVSAPTGAGKTALFEMAMARLLSGNMTSRQVRNERLGELIALVSKVRKVVYIAPNKALCEERQINWSKRLVDINSGIVCTTITGDAKASSCFAEIASAHMILTTPEKWDSITRRWNNQFVLLSSIKLVLIDKVHLIGKKERGGCLESVICCMKTIQRAACARKLTSSEIASLR